MRPDLAHFGVEVALVGEAMGESISFCSYSTAGAINCSV